MKRLTALIWLAGLISPLAFAAAESISIPVAPNVDVPVTRYHSTKQRLILWLPSEVGVMQAEHDTAAKLARRGYSVWVADLFGARFFAAGLEQHGQHPRRRRGGINSSRRKTISQNNSYQ